MRNWRDCRWACSLLLAGGVAALLSACGDDGGPVTRPEERLDFVTFAPTAPPPATTDTSFWAFAGRDTTVEILYEGTGKRFLRLELDEESLLRRPDGTLFQPGDSVLISIRVEPGRFVVDLQPTGLRFRPDAPAELEIRYEFADDSFLEREPAFQLWRQERLGELWFLAPFLQIEDFDEIEADLEGFTRYAVAI